MRRAGLAFAVAFAVAVAVAAVPAGGCASGWLSLPPPGPVGRIGSTVCLNADGPAGRDSYEIIESVLGPGLIEHPDADHAPPERHVAEDVDRAVGAHFVFSMHRDLDRDRANTDRQRMEIKVFDKSDDRLKAREGSTFTYSWRFKLPAGMRVSRRFTHLFQLKPVGGDDRMPLVTITGARRGDDRQRLEVRYMWGGATMVLADADWDGSRDRWLEATCQATFSHRGALALRVTGPDGTVLLDVERRDLDLWHDGDFVRPKWGIYRGLTDVAALNEEDEVRFASFALTAGTRPDSACR